MEKLIKVIGVFIGLGFLNSWIFALYLPTTGLPGGEVGMAPILIGIDSLITVIISTLIYLLIRNKINLTITKAILMYQIIYLLTLVFSGVSPLDINMNNDYGRLTLWTYLIPTFLAFGLIVITYLFNKVVTTRG